jgi:hypothetical protein
LVAVVDAGESAAAQNVRNKQKERRRRRRRERGRGDMMRAGGSAEVRTFTLPSFSTSLHSLGTVPLLRTAKNHEGNCRLAGVETREEKECGEGRGGNGGVEESGERAYTLLHFHPPFRLEFTVPLPVCLSTIRIRTHDW